MSWNSENIRLAVLRVRDLEMELDRMNLRRKMYENRAINDGPEEFDHWADLIDEEEKNIQAKGRELGMARLTLYREQARECYGPGYDV